jgi:hypothetical protein
MTFDIMLMVWAATLLLAGAAAALLSPPLRLILQDLCKTAERARFWTVYSCLLIIAVPLLFVSVPGVLDAAAASGHLGAILQRTVFLALAGILFALLIIGKNLRRSVARAYEAKPEGDFVP